MKTVLARGRLTILVEDERIVVYDSIQATVYTPYMSGNDNLFPQMREFLLTSEDTEYRSWIDILELASACKVVGYGTREPFDKTNKLDYYEDNASEN